MAELPNQPTTRRSARRWIILLVAAAVVMGLPTLRGSFVGGDDHRLLLNHVLVNRPSLTHALQLFTIVHRDLYQPLPLLTFSGEFLIARATGLLDHGAESAAWIFHLTNILLHALNTLVVFHLIRTLHARVRRDDGPAEPGTWIAGVTALLFAVHPFQVETVAWINGRMMLLSTLFALLALLAMLRRLDGGGAGYALLAVVCVLLSAISKVRAPLVMLIPMVAWMSGKRLRSVRFVTLWAAAAVVIALLVWVNIDATSQADLFAEGAEHLRGPRAVRVLLSVAFYFQHLVLPIGLTSYHPTPPIVSWWDSATAWAALEVLLGGGLLAALARRSRAAMWGTLWFFVMITDTLPFFPARNILAADRYMYFPIIGLFWVLAEALHAALGRRRSHPMTIVAGGVLAATLIGVSWFTAVWYDTPLQKTLRVANCYPDEPRVWEMTGWCYYQLGEYDDAIRCAEKELRHDARKVQSGAYQLMGMSTLRKGQGEEALNLLRRAMESDPESETAVTRLGTALDELGRHQEAAAVLEDAVRASPMHNPTMHRLAGVYRKLGRIEDARMLYERELSNNDYEVEAVLALCELDLAEGTPAALEASRARLAAMLSRVGDHAAMRVSLGVVLYTLGRPSEAIEQYVLALSDEPRNPVAAANLSRLVLSGELPKDPRVRDAICQIDDTFSSAGCALLDAAAGRPDAALDAAARLAGTGEAEEARRLLLGALERLDQSHPQPPWAVAVAVEVLLAGRNTEVAETFMGILTQRCKEPGCPPIVDRLRRELSALGGPRSGTP